MVFEAVQQGFAAADNGIVLFCESIANPEHPTASELAAGTRITYGLTATGFDLQNTQNNITTGRYTMGQELTIDGTQSDALTLTYVYNRENPTAVEEVLDAKGTTGFIVHALGYVNDHRFTAGDVINEVIPVRLRQSVAAPAAENAEPTKSQQPHITGRVARDATVTGQAS